MKLLYIFESCIVNKFTFFDLRCSVVHAYANMLESDLTYISLRPEQLSNGMDAPMDEETSSMDEIPLRNSKPAKKKGTTILQ